MLQCVVYKMLSVSRKHHPIDLACCTRFDEFDSLVDEAKGAAIEVEVWELSPAAFGDFVSKIPGPLGIGKVLLENGEELPGFIAEPRAADGAEEITSFGGWKAWLGRA